MAMTKFAEALFTDLMREHGAELERLDQQVARETTRPLPARPRPPRRRATFAAASASLLVAAATAVAVPVVLSGTSTSPMEVSAKAPFRLSFTVAVNGQSRVFPKNGPPPSFTVSPGESLKIRIGVIVPAHARVTALWLGVARGAFGPGRDGRPIGVRPILAHTRRPLTPGLHTFRLRWTVPAALSDGTALVATWATKENQARAGQFIAELATPR
jgi:hypothetical protein